MTMVSNDLEHLILMSRNDCWHPDAEAQTQSPSTPFSPAYDLWQLPNDQLSPTDK